MNIFKPNGIREIDFDLTKTAIKALKKQWSNHVKNISPYPDSFSGKGIVMCAGGLKYFTCVWISIQIIRDLGCTLPIEVWYIGNELSKDIIKSLNKKGVVCKNILDHDGEGLCGWMLKTVFHKVCKLKSSFNGFDFLILNTIRKDESRRFLIGRLFEAVQDR